MNQFMDTLLRRFLPGKPCTQEITLTSEADRKEAERRLVELQRRTWLLKQRQVWDKADNP